jgi:hypothetical protein
MFLSVNYKKAIELLENGKIEESKQYFLKAYEEGLKKSLYYLRKIRNEQSKFIANTSDFEYETLKSNLGYEVDIPNHFKKLDTINDKCFDTITIEKNDDFELYNIKTQCFLIEIPNGCIDLISIENIISHISNIDNIIDFENEKTKGKIIKTKAVEGSISYTLLSLGKLGIYEFKIIVDEFLEPYYKNVIDKIFNSFHILNV